MNRLEEALRRYDGKTTDGLAEISAAFGDRHSLLSELVGLATHEEALVSEAATWLIKAQLDNGARLTGPETEALLGRLDRVTPWQAQLHICQSVRHFDVPTQLAIDCVEWFEALLTSDRPFLRAWSMDALQELAQQNAELAQRTEMALAAAEQDPAASVRSRARRWRKRAKSR